MLPQNPSTEALKSYLANCAMKYQINFERSMDLFHRYYDFLSVENEKYNLISSGDLDKVGGRHFLDAIQVLGHLKRPCSILDAGSGWGVPGIPINICFPGIELTIVESNMKKSNFMRMAIENLGLKEVRVLTERAEVAGQLADYREAFDYVVTRAMAKSSVAMELTIPFLKAGGRAIYWTGGAEWSDSVGVSQVLSILGGRLVNSYPYSLPGDPDGFFRQLVIIEKIGPTPGQYPRRTGVPDKKPL